VKWIPARVADAAIYITQKFSALKWQYEIFISATRGEIFIKKNKLKLL